MLPQLTRGARSSLIERAGRILEAWAGDKAPATLRAYGSDLAAFAAWAGCLSHAEAVAALLAVGPHKAQAHALRWQGSMRELAPRTVARRLSMLRSIVRTAHRERAVLWTLELRGPKVQRGATRRDSDGPPVRDVARMLAHVARARDPMAVRDLAVLYLLVDSGLRRSELCSLHVRHVDLAQRRIRIESKGAGGDRATWHVSPRGRDAIAAWLELRTAAPGPLFTADPEDRRGIVPSTVYRIVRRRAQAAGFHGHGWRPHGFRHTAGTELTRRSSAKTAQLFLRHADVATTLAWYDDQPGDLTREIVDQWAQLCSLEDRHAAARRLRRGVQP